MDTPEEQDEIGRIMSRDAAIRSHTEPMLQIIKNLNFCILQHNAVLSELLRRVETLEKKLEALNGDKGRNPSEVPGGAGGHDPIPRR